MKYQLALITPFVILTWLVICPVAMLIEVHTFQDNDNFPKACAIDHGTLVGKDADICTVNGKVVLFK
jgi:hypothetical protein